MLNISVRKKYRLTLRAVFLFLGVTGTYISSLLMELSCYKLSLIPAFFVLVATIGEFIIADILIENKFPTTTSRLLENLEFSLKNVHNQLIENLDEIIESLKECDKKKVSGTIHLKVPIFSSIDDGIEFALLQITDYKGNLGGGRWRFVHYTKGLGGRCLRTGKAEDLNFMDEAEYEKRMIREFGYTREEIELHTKEARSYWVQPILKENILIGVIFLFSTETNTFPKAIDRDSIEKTSKQITRILTAARIIH